MQTAKFVINMTDLKLGYMASTQRGIGTDNQQANRQTNKPIK